VKLWNAIEGTLVRTLEGHVNSVYTLNFHPSSRFVCTGSADHTVYVWNVDVNL
jgi:WD40 repeat protein